MKHKASQDVAKIESTGKKNRTILFDNDKTRQANFALKSIPIQAGESNVYSAGLGKRW